MTRRFRIMFVVFSILLVSFVKPHAAWAAHRLAMVVGIDRYGNFGADAQLRRAVADAESMGQSLQRLGFEVTTLADGLSVGQDVFLRKFANFVGGVQPGDTVLFYFAGHGVGINGVNYLLPADVPNLADADQYLFRAHAVAEGDIRSRIQERGAAVTILMLDACRNNPFHSTDRSVAFARGLAPIDPTNGVLTIYAAGYGQTALDRLSDDSDPSPNSVFTRVVLNELERPGINLIDFSEDVRERVATLARSVGHDQVPAVDNQLLGGRFIYLDGRPSSVETSPPPGPVGDETVWSYVRSTNDASALHRFIKDYPDSAHKGEAETLVASLDTRTIDPPVRAQAAPSVPVSPPPITASLRPADATPPVQAPQPSVTASLNPANAPSPPIPISLPPTTASIHPAHAQPPVQKPTAEDVEWARAASSTFSSVLVTEFLIRHPHSPLRPPVEARLTMLDEILWSRTSPEDASALRRYLTLFPNGVHRSQAGTRVNALERIALTSKEEAPPPADPALSPPRVIRPPPKVRARAPSVALDYRAPTRRTGSIRHRLPFEGGCFESGGERFCP